ncbi:AMP-binding protein, partial [Hymenobacter lapidiphilus]|uniref:AMP-binding protein n=1 Tax=Hymenobacter sp. CCM 8763 TaxID=2303334 RepID=UPI0018F89E6A
RNLVYAAFAYAKTVGIADKPFEAVSYLPLCHVAERCYGTVTHMSFEALCERGKAYGQQNPDADATLDRLISQGTPDDVCILVYTSGTTGPPKGAMLTHRNLVYAAFAYAKTVGIADKPFEAVSYLPLCHVAERCYGTVTH